MIIGIDTSHSKKYSGLVFGSNEAVFEFYKESSNIFQKLGLVPPLHWQILSSNSRKTVFNNLFPKLSQTKLKFWIFEHSKPMEIKRKEFYLKQIPSRMAYSLEPLLSNAQGLVQIQADKDFEVKNVQSSNLIFLENLVKQLSFRIYGSEVRVFRTNKEVYSVFKNKGNELKFLGFSVDSKTSKAVQIADIILGMFNFDANRMRKIVKFYKM